MYEYFCVACKQLRLHAREGRPSSCGNCGSDRILIAHVGSKHLSFLRFGKKEPNAPITVVLLKG
jgi:DNA-directed RNA polymerase subunit RPC12/RpoP